MSERQQAEVPLGIGDHLKYMPALDGVRAISILGIMANHAGFAWAGGGVISVNVFFVLSGFLITMLLMKEWTRSGTIRLRSFWARRARRLLPALFVLLAAIGIYALFFAPDGTLGSLRTDGLSTLLYFSNWHEILSGQSYFNQLSLPSPLLHTWTLAIEEQFYLVWPIVVVLVLKFTKSTRVLFIVAVVGVLASAIEMALLFHQGTDPSRIYYGTDTRAQDILTGAALGILLFSRPPVSSQRVRTGFSWMAILGGTVFVLEWIKINGSPDVTYRGGFLLADVMVAMVICGVVMAPRGIPARLLSFGPLTFVGRISYGLYLWHWPIFLVVNGARTGLEGWSLFALRLLVTFAFAIASWYLVETPIRQQTWTNWRSWSWIPVGVVMVVGVLFLTTLDDPTGTNLFLNPQVLAARINQYEHGTFPAQTHKLKVLVVGDSLSLTVGFWLNPYASHYGLVLQGRPLEGCGLATALPFNEHGTITYGTLSPCKQWPTLWGNDVKQLHPQVVVLVIGWWEAMDRMYQGKWQHLGDPAFDAYEKGQIQKAVAVLSAEGAHVVLTTSPYFDSGEQLNGQPWDEDSPARVNVLNHLINIVAGQHSQIVSVVPLNKYLDPDGHYTLKIDGKIMRFADGVHTTQDAGTYLAPKILPQLALLGSSK